MIKRQTKIRIIFTLILTYILAVPLRSFATDAVSIGGSWGGYEALVLGNGDVIFFISASDQTFSVDDGATAMSEFTIEQEFGLSVDGSINVTDDIRITIPENLLMLWDEDDTVAAISGISADGTVSPNVTFVTGARTVVFDVTTAFINGASIKVSGLNFENFTEPSLGENLEIEIDNAGTKIAQDYFQKLINLPAAASVPTGGSEDGFGLIGMFDGFSMYIWNGFADAATWADEYNWVPGIGWPDDSGDIALISSGSDSIMTSGTITVGEASLTSGFGGSLTLGGPMTISKCRRVHWQPARAGLGYQQCGLQPECRRDADSFWCFHCGRVDDHARRGLGLHGRRVPGRNVDRNLQSGRHRTTQSPPMGRRSTTSSSTVTARSGPWRMTSRSTGRCASLTVRSTLQSRTSQLRADWLLESAGRFGAGEGTVIFNNAAVVSDVYGGTSFYNLTITTPSKRVNFEAGAVFTIAGTLDVNGGATATHVSLDSTNSTDRFTFELTGGSANRAVRERGEFECEYQQYYG